METDDCMYERAQYQFEVCTSLDELIQLIS